MRVALVFLVLMLLFTAIIVPLYIDCIIGLPLWRLGFSNTIPLLGNLLIPRLLPFGNLSVLLPLLLKLAGLLRFPLPLPALSFGMPGATHCLVELCPELANFEDHAVSNFISPGGEWIIPAPFSAVIQNEIYRVIIWEENSDCIAWANSGKFLFKNLVSDYYISVPDCNWMNFIWHKRHSLRFSLFTWLALVGGLKTVEELKRRNIIMDSSCPLCSAGAESVNHFFFDCNYTHSIIITLIPEVASFYLRPNLLQTFDWVNDHPTLSSQHKYILFITICCTVYYTWRERNERRFAPSASSVSTTKIKIKNAILCKITKWCDNDILRRFTN
ncbi:hypothetical protein KFK09_020845 [Dendrobium nobile]|uniref:Reverse transcriptase zinc-binding domain-containing protein n=1 Tax=Dendrobium nobile TaxID=94219 RepID=A0A8T3AMT2_DENNO|nr:hypothetical protein KFK09_020845 [Dendrobium nobile]